MRLSLTQTRLGFVRLLQYRTFPGKTNSQLKNYYDRKNIVADDVSESGLPALVGAGVVVEKRIKLPAEELIKAIADCDGLIVRSETKFTSDLLDAAKNLRVIGRAGVGVDNIDVAAATARGI